MTRYIFDDIFRFFCCLVLRWEKKIQINSIEIRIWSMQNRKNQKKLIKHQLRTMMIRMMMMIGFWFVVFSSSFVSNRLTQCEDWDNQTLHNTLLLDNVMMMIMMINTNPQPTKLVATFFKRKKQSRKKLEKRSIFRPEEWKSTEKNGFIALFSRKENWKFHPNRSIETLLIGTPWSLAFFHKHQIRT